VGGRKAAPLGAAPLGKGGECRLRQPRGEALRRGESLERDGGGAAERDDGALYEREGEDSWEREGAL
jgi:hypothetical protein